MSQIESITIDTQNAMIRVQLENGTGLQFSGSLADFRDYLRSLIPAENTWQSVAAVLLAKFEQDPTLSNTSDVVGKPFEFVTPVDQARTIIATSNIPTEEDPA